MIAPVPTWLPKSITPQFLKQAEQVAALIDEGYPTRMIAHRMALSPARVTQLRQQMIATQLLESRRPTERPANSPERLTRPTERLTGRREELRELRMKTLALARQIGKDLRALDEELEAAVIDRQLGLRVS